MDELQKRAAELFDETNEQEEVNEVNLDKFLREQEIENERLRQHISEARKQVNTDNPYAKLSLDELREKHKANSIVSTKIMQEINGQADKYKIIAGDLNKVVNKVTGEMVEYEELYKGVSQVKFNNDLLVSQLFTIINRLTKENGKLKDLVIEQKDIIEQMQTF
jgi:hypothetical protein